ncbi:hypothetical protein O6H91_07G034000 [Diphasiastrum complanatum]|uniref:Uncharacterized protein n=1 Tax=Diphasiastrum complanatum TaxID=34168 RepID=A0ACC2D3U8_DIPCM|nr:hypothetical protein O6H91_07G034000 [Diphasiastrum complanatum]
MNHLHLTLILTCSVFFFAPAHSCSRSTRTCPAKKTFFLAVSSLHVASDRPFARFAWQFPLRQPFFRWCWPYDPPKRPVQISGRFIFLITSSYKSTNNVEGLLLLQAGVSS